MRHHLKKWPKLNPTKKQLSLNCFIVGIFLRNGCPPTDRALGDPVSMLVLILGAS